MNLGKEVEVTTSEDITVEAHCEECDSELEVTKAVFSYGVLDVVVKPCKCQVEEEGKE